MKHTKQDVLRHMKKCFEQFGELTVDTYEEYRKNIKHSPSLPFIVNHFGWNNMVRELKLRPNRRLNTEEILEKMKEKILELGYIPTTTEWMKNKYSPSLFNLEKTHGFTYREALEYLGFSYPHTRGTRGRVENRICPCCHSVVTGVNLERLKKIKKIQKKLLTCTIIIV